VLVAATAVEPMTKTDATIAMSEVWAGNARAGLVNPLPSGRMAICIVKLIHLTDEEGLCKARGRERRELSRGWE
jgi:hypothetical protein